jgi:hypothetical protein
VASGYVWFDVMAMLVAPYLVALARRRSTDELRAFTGSQPGRTTSTPRAKGYP